MQTSLAGRTVQTCQSETACCLTRRQLPLAFVATRFCWSYISSDTPDDRVRVSIVNLCCLGCTWMRKDQAGPACGHNSTSFWNSHRKCINIYICHKMYTALILFIPCRQRFIQFILHELRAGEMMFIQTYYRPARHAGCLVGSHKPLASLTACRWQKCPCLRNSPSSVLTVYRAGKQKVLACI